MRPTRPTCPRLKKLSGDSPARSRKREITTRAARRPGPSRSLARSLALQRCTGCERTSGGAESSQTEDDPRRSVGQPSAPLITPPLSDFFLLEGENRASRRLQHISTTRSRFRISPGQLEFATLRSSATFFYAGIVLLSLLGKCDCITGPPRRGISPAAAAAAEVA